MSPITLHRTQTELKLHQGIFRHQLSLFQGIALITSSIIGAGVLGIPYAIAKTGILIGLAYILGLGLLMMGLNLMLGEITVRTHEPLQLSGLAGKYLGRFGKSIMSIVVFSMLFGALLIYIIGEGEALAAVFGGNQFLWSLGFFFVAAILVGIGLRTVKTIELFLTLGVLLIVLLIAVFSFPHINVSAIEHVNLAHLFFPYGIVLFALHGVTAIPEAHSLLKNNNTNFHKAIIISMSIAMLVYAIFSIVVVGVTGDATTPIATIGLGQKIGPSMFLLGNLFAIFAMGTSFLVVGVALRDSLTWDFKFPKWLATVTTLFIPIALFLFGIRQFIVTLDIVGGLFGSIEMLLIVAIYVRAKRQGHVPTPAFALKHSFLLTSLLVVTFSIGAVYSVLKLF